MDRMVLRVVVVRVHPVILSDLSLVVPVLDAGFWVVERRSDATRYRERQFAVSLFTGGKVFSDQLAIVVSHRRGWLVVLGAQFALRA